jgi:hypothetical protein
MKIELGINIPSSLAIFIRIFLTLLHNDLFEALPTFIKENNAISKAEPILLKYNQIN